LGIERKFGFVRAEPTGMGGISSSIRPRHVVSHLGNSGSVGRVRKRLESYGIFSTFTGGWPAFHAASGQAYSSDLTGDCSVNRGPVRRRPTVRTDAIGGTQFLLIFFTHTFLKCLARSDGLVKTCRGQNLRVQASARKNRRGPPKTTATMLPLNVSFN